MASSRENHPAPCTECGARLRIRSSRRIGGGYRMRYLECRKCGTGLCRCVVKAGEAQRRNYNTR